MTPSVVGTGAGSVAGGAVDVVETGMFGAAVARGAVVGATLVGGGSNTFVAEPLPQAARQRTTGTRTDALPVRLMWRP